MGRSARRSGQVGRRSPAAPIVGVDQSVASLVDGMATTLAALESPIQEAREIVASLLDVPRHWPLLYSNKWVDADLWQRASLAAGRRAAGVPLAYAVGRTSFRAWTLEVDQRVLIPRPETELLVDLVLKWKPRGGTVIDVGTGSGAIAIALAKEGMYDRVIATDVSCDALDVARGNSARLDAEDIVFLHGTLLRPVAKGVRADVIVSNPPYIAFSEVAALPASVRNYEPMVALLSGHDGLSITAQLVRQAASYLEPGGLLALEVDAKRAALVAEMLSSDARYGDVTVQLDFTGRERFVLATREEQG